MSDPSCAIALVPLRSPGQGKTRLREVLTRGDRAELAAAMLADVLAALRDAEVARTIVVASGPASAETAASLGAETRLDPADADGLDAAVAAAQRDLGQVSDLLVVAADLPRLTGGDVRDLLSRDAEVVVAPTRGGGTGGLLRRPGDRIATAYGPGSAAAHLALAERAAATATTVHRTGFTEDVDTADDLRELTTGPLGPATSALLARWGRRPAPRTGTVG